MEQNELLCEINEKLDKLSRKMDKLVTLNTKIAKSLHLLPVTEREERELQLLQRTNMQLAAKVNDDLNSLSPKSEEVSQLSVGNLDISSIFADVLGEEYLSKEQ